MYSTISPAYSNIKTRMSYSPIAFKGKDTVTHSLLGETAEVPREVYEAGDTVKRVYMAKYDNLRKGCLANIICLDGKNKFLGLAHILKYKPPYMFCMGKSILQNGVTTQNLDGPLSFNLKSAHDWDLGLYTIQNSLVYAKSAKTKLGDDKKLKPDEDVYIISYQEKGETFSGLQYIPAKFIKHCGQIEKAVNMTEGQKADYFEIQSKILHENNINLEGFSGSAIVNKKGELVGILARVAPDEAPIYAIDMNTIKAFLKATLPCT